MIQPIITYGAEIWFPVMFNWEDNMDMNEVFRKCLSGSFPFENIHAKFCRQILGIHKKAMILPTLGELGRFPIMFAIIQQIISFWFHILNKKQNSYIKLLNNYSYKNDDRLETNG